MTSRSFAMLSLRRCLPLAALVSVLAMPGFAQRGRYTSPEAKTSATIGGKVFTVDYYAPSRHDRKVMGGLVPYGQVWCTGANIATGFTLGADIQIGDMRLPKGAYSIWTLPTEKEWTLIINKETGQFHLNYNPSLDFGRAKMNVKTLPAQVETFRVDLRPEGGNKGILALVWENTEASIPFTVLQ
jgi:hypothetical protein